MILYMCFGFLLLNAIFINVIRDTWVFAYIFEYCNRHLKEIIPKKTNRYKYYVITTQTIIHGYFLLLIACAIYMIWKIELVAPTGKPNLVGLLQTNFLFLCLFWIMYKINIAVEVLRQTYNRIETTTKYLKQNGLKLLKICCYIYTYTRATKLAGGTLLAIFSQIEYQNGWWVYDEFCILIESDLIKLRDKLNNITVYSSYTEFLCNFETINKK
ncbi:MAG: hypothetical protein K2Y14_07285 [Burkholderiales bacterium]|nr:hypothetical protein [Burkholderiales bacterium]